MRRLEDELGFIKKHHELELDMLKEQYERSLETAKLIATESSNLNRSSTHVPNRGGSNSVYGHRSSSPM